MTYSTSTYDTPLYVPFPDDIRPPYGCPYISPCERCRWTHEPWLGIVSPCVGCPWNLPQPQPWYFPTYPTPYYQYEITC